jgi:ankyrin repeat protein
MGGRREAGWESNKPHLCVLWTNKHLGLTQEFFESPQSVGVLLSCSILILIRDISRFFCVTDPSNPHINQSFVLRYYENPLIPDFLRDVSGIAQANSAGRLSVLGIMLRHHLFVEDSSSLHNNPIHFLRQEAGRIWPGQIDNALIISIGAGDHSKVLEVEQDRKTISTRNEDIADEFFAHSPQMVENGLLYRLNVFLGLENTGIDEYRWRMNIADNTKYYLNRGEMLQRLENCVRGLQTPRRGEIETASERVSETISKPLSPQTETPTPSELIQNGIVFPKSSEGLFRAINASNVAQIQEILRSGVDIEARSPNGDTPLIRAYRRKRVEVLGILLNAGADPDAKLERSDDSDYLLHYMVEHRDLESAELLCASGADINIKDSKGQTPLYKATELDSVAMVRLLAHQGANLDCYTDLEEKSTVLHVACKLGHVAVAHSLIVMGANIEARAADQSTPLLLAARNGCVEIVAHLIEAGAKVEAADMGKRRAIHVAAESNHAEVADLLLNNHADIEAREIEGHTALLMAIKEGHLEVTELLIKHGANVRSTTKNGFQAIHIAAYYGRLEIAEITKLLLAKGVDVEARDSSGRTPLYFAVCSNHIGLVRLLLGKGANPRSWQYHGTIISPLGLAQDAGYVAIARLLSGESHGVDY